jgi:hypothetical protein
MKVFVKILALMIVAFAGGFFATLFINFLKPIALPSTGDAVSIANTYIVFTTIIFVGFTVVLGVAGYVFSQQFATSKEMHEDRLIQDLKLKLQDNEKISWDIIQAALDNEAIKLRLTETLENKVNQIVTDKVTELELTAGSDFNEMSGSIDGGDANG